MVFIHAAEIPPNVLKIRMLCLYLGMVLIALTVAFVEYLIYRMISQMISQ
jgi:hypothetical protein